MSHASVIQDDEVVTALKEQIIELKQEMERQETDLQGVVLARERKIHMLEQEIEELRTSVSHNTGQ